MYSYLVCHKCGNSCRHTVELVHDTRRCSLSANGSLFRDLGLDTGGRKDKWWDAVSAYRETRLANRWNQVMKPETTQDSTRVAEYNSTELPTAKHGAAIARLRYEAVTM